MTFNLPIRRSSTHSGKFPQGLNSSHLLSVQFRLYYHIYRAWREHQFRIVGFPGRGVAWNSTGSSWSYDALPCHVNFVLTGAAFVHKFYYYLYTYDMPRDIRSRVDTLLNCEDLAMNFLVSNVTRAPPLKVTTRDDFTCPKCPQTQASDSLSSRKKHYEERSDCINYFAQVGRPILTRVVLILEIILKIDLIFAA